MHSEPVAREGLASSRNDAEGDARDSPVKCVSWFEDLDSDSVPHDRPKDKESDAGLSSIQEALRHAQSLLKDQAERHLVEQERLLDRLIADAAVSSGEADPFRVEQLTAPEPNYMSGRHSIFSSASEGPQFGPRVLRQASTKDENHHAFYAIEPTDSLQVRSSLDRLEEIAKLAIGFKDEYSPGSMMQRFVSGIQKLRTCEEPKRSGCLATVVSSGCFACACILAIGLNALFLIYSTDYMIAHGHEDGHTWHTSVEVSFIVFYFVELMLKLCVHRLYFFWSDDFRWNVLDFTLVTVSVVELAFFILDSQGPAGINVTFMRSFRVFKIAKVLRVFRSIRFFSELRLMFDCVLGSLFNLFWCLVMILFVVGIFSLFMVQGVSQAVNSVEHQWTLEEEAQVRVWFDSVLTGIVTLLQCTTNGLGWGEVYKLLLLSRDPLLYWSFVAYILFFALAAWNIVTSLFVDKALKLALPDADTLALERNIEDSKDAEDLSRMFKVFDIDGSGGLSKDELSVIMESSKFRNGLRARGIEITDPSLFYKMLLSVTGEVDTEIQIDLLVSACLRLKGNASSMDLHALSFEAKLTQRRLKAHIRDSISRLDRIEEAVFSLVQFKGESPERCNDIALSL